jgi:hypothetical protein
LNLQPEIQYACVSVPKLALAVPDAAGIGSEHRVAEVAKGAGDLYVEPVGSHAILEARVEDVDSTGPDMG